MSEVVWKFRSTILLPQLIFSFVLPGTSNITVGADIDQALQNSARRVSGHISAGGQYHFYMETQAAVACSVDGDNITVTCGSQYPTLYQSQIATVLGVPLNKVRPILFLLCCCLSYILKSDEGFTT